MSPFRSNLAQTKSGLNHYAGSFWKSTWLVGSEVRELEFQDDVSVMFVLINIP